MPTILSHAVVPLALGVGLGGRLVSHRLLVAGVAASILPDLDVLAFRLNVGYSDAFGHRGASHSIAFAVFAAFLALLFAQRLNSGRLSAFMFVGVCTASHGVLDMFTNGGYGVALWWPMSAERVFAPWQVIEVTPLSLRRFFSGRGFEVLQSEFLWIWLPAMVVCVALAILRRRSVRGVR